MLRQFCYFSIEINWFLRLNPSLIYTGTKLNVCPDISESLTVTIINDRQIMAVKNLYGFVNAELIPRGREC